MKWFKFTLALLLAAAFAYLGFNLPSNFRSLDRRVLATAGKGTQTIKELAEARIEQDQVGPVKLMLAAGLVDISEEKVQKATDRQYYYPFTGGPDEHFAKFLERIGDDAIGKSLRSGIRMQSSQPPSFCSFVKATVQPSKIIFKSRRAQRSRAYLIAAEVRALRI